ncbi:MAG TPA: SpoIIE family protein phosphatase [Acidimicrobiales bacterium]|nr:SpoIIE family protein phosphatase [Acidimicrobiales bacterium]
MASFFRGAPVGLAFVDTERRVRTVNDLFADFTGQPIEDHAGRSLAELVPDAEGFLTALIDQARSTGTRTAELEVPRRSGGRSFTASCYPLVGDGIDGVAIVVHDVTKSRQAADELDARVRQQAGLALYEQRALVVDDVGQLMTDAVAVLADVLGLELVAVLRVDREADDFEVVAARGWGDDAVGRRVSGKQDLLPGYALASGAPVFVADFAVEHRFRLNPLLAQQRPAGGMSVVIPGHTEPFGVLSAHTATPRSFRADEIGFVESVANVFGAALARVRAAAALAAEQTRLRLALDAGGMGDWEWHLPTDRLSWSPTLEAIFGLAPGSFGGAFDDFISLVHPDDRAPVSSAMRDAVTNEAPFKAEFRAIGPDRRERWIHATGVVVRDDDGRPTEMIGVGTDITARVLADEAEQGARDRLAFLAEANEVLSSSLDYEDTLTKLAHLVVGPLADWCTVAVLEEGDVHPTTLVVAHRDPARMARAEELRRRYPPTPRSGEGLLAVIETGEPVIIEEVTDEMLVEAALDEEHLDMLREFFLRSVMMVPLNARGRTLGVISLVATESGRVYSEDDLALAMDLARRAAVAIDNARLYEERSRVAEALQASLLPPRQPDIPGFDLAVRYRPVGRGAEIGGDFYDVFETAAGDWSVVIGDVCGKGTEAAAITGLARDTIRGLSLRERSPARVLAVLNEAIRRRDDVDEGRFLTVALSRFARADDGAHLRVASGGHPLPLVVRSDGQVAEVGTHGLMLGLFPEVDLEDVAVELRPGDTVVFFTDGVTEERGEGGMFGEARLRAVLSTVAGEHPETVAQSVLDAVDAWQPGPAHDDMAVVALRVPQG